MKIERVDPIGTKQGLAFVEHRDRTRSGVEVVEISSYPPSPKGAALRAARTALGLTLRDASRAAGLTAAEWCGLERGSYSVDDWSEPFAILERAKPTTTRSKP